MNSILKSVLLLIASIFGLNANAQTKPIENTLLWEISGNGLTKPSYLFGTIHMICGKDYVLKPKVQEAFNKTTKLALEINLSDPNEIAYMQKALMGSELLSKKLSAAQLSELEIILQKQAGLSVKDVDAYTLPTLMSLLSVRSFDCQDLKVYEMELLSKASEDKKEIIGLESIKDQIDFLNKSYSDDQMLNLFKTINQEETKKMVKNYTNENLEEIYKGTVNTDVMDANAQHWMLEVRNANWLKAMPQLMEKESVFFAVGSAHLAGEKGLINLLKQKGYSVKPMLK